ncbi:MAG: argininosuccinate lyase [Pyrinomonadaceae bacterium]|nr:argininosuccinate lyase [Pyrinomonadaceae bacterium]MCX7639679.1 argininosuccinate lyase [Pyrinomonadaceae bacterium]MDW8304581.1 argininosuccinate lyase [Acidobacteriota bacterium]
MSKAENLWKGRFVKESNATFTEFNNSFRFDRRLFEADVIASLAYCNALFYAGVLTKTEAEKIQSGLKTLLKRAAYSSSFFDEMQAEDVHSFIEAKLTQLIGETAKKLHTGRSRNDQVATALRLWLREEIKKIVSLTIDLQFSLILSAESNIDAIMPGYTHLQRAQPILWSHWCLAYFEMLKRDRERFEDNFRRTNILPLGSGALAGTNYEIDREEIAYELEFDSVTTNSLDAVSDRDFAIEFLSSCSILMMHLSRFAEDLILYSSQEFDFIELSDSVSTGSSLMPQKKNPDALELIRGKTGRVFGHQIALLTTLKGLPLAYNKDMQEDKEAIFDTVDTVKSCLKIAKIVIENIKLKKEKMLAAATKGYLNATELADYLVQKGIAFRDAHYITGQIVLYAINQGKELNELSMDEMHLFSEAISEDVFDYLSVKKAISNKNQIGGTATERVAECIKKAKDEIRKINPHLKF